MERRPFRARLVDSVPLLGSVTYQGFGDALKARGGASPSPIPEAPFRARPAARRFALGHQRVFRDGVRISVDVAMLGDSVGHQGPYVDLWNPSATRQAGASGFASVQG